MNTNLKQALPLKYKEFLGTCGKVMRQQNANRDLSQKLQFAHFMPCVKSKSSFEGVPSAQTAATTNFYFC
jgi:hypothetical protein